jgi:hypothetical protein
MIFNLIILRKGDKKMRNEKDKIMRNEKLQIRNDKKRK